MRRIDKLTRRSPVQGEQRYSVTDLYNDWILGGGFGGMNPVTTWSSGDNVESPPNNFQGYSQSGYKGNGIVFAVLNARLRLFTEARFAWRDWSNGKPGALYTNQDLAPVQEPWVGGTTRDLLARMEQDASLNGQFYGVYRNLGAGRVGIQRLRPDWVELFIGSPSGDVDDVDAWCEGILYYPGGIGNRGKREFYPMSQVVHYAPLPDPEARFRGMSWLTPIIREIQSDTGATVHKGKFFENAGTPNLAVSIPKPMPKDEFLSLVDAMDAQHKGAVNAYKTMWLMGGADLTVVGNSLRDLDYKAVQGAGETRIAAAGGVPPVIVGLSEGLAAATYSNYGQARRAFADLWARPQWGAAAAALQHVLKKPNGTSELWYDESGISFLQEDQMDAAEILSRRMLTVEAGVRAGFDPQSVVAAINAQDLTLLSHTGLYSVQLQPPTDGTAAPAPNPAP